MWSLDPLIFSSDGIDAMRIINCRPTFSIENLFVFLFRSRERSDTNRTFPSPWGRARNQQSQMTCTNITWINQHGLCRWVCRYGTWTAVQRTQIMDPRTATTVFCSSSSHIYTFAMSTDAMFEMIRSRQHYSRLKNVKTCPTDQPISTTYILEAPAYSF